MKAVADSSFLIAVATIDAFPLLSQIFSEVFIPEAVYDEVVIRGAGLPGAKEVADAAWIKRIVVKDANKVKAYRAERLGVGEAEALALAEELRADLVLIDDERAWETAQRKGIAYLRSIEFMLEAHRRHLKGNVIELEGEATLPEGTRVSIIPEQPVPVTVPQHPMTLHDWLQEARQVRAQLPKTSDSVEILRQLREERVSR